MKRSMTDQGESLPSLEGPWCYYIPPSQDPTEHGGYVPSVVEAGKPGHWPLLGRGPCAQPWIWGSTLAEAEAVCAAQNADRGIDQEQALRIVASSMGAGRARRKEE